MERTKIKRPYTAQEIATLNKECQEKHGYTRHKKGETTEGFWTRADAFNAGVDYFNSKYKGILFDEGYACCSAWKKVIAWPPEFNTLVKEMNDLADEFQGLNGYECPKKHEKLVERLDGRWYKRYSKLQELCKTSPPKN